MMIPQYADLDDTMQLIVNRVKPSFKLHEHPNMKKRQKLFLESVNHVRTTTDACVHIYSDANNLDLFPRNDHCNLPKLTEVHKMFISPVNINMCAYHLEGSGIAYKGQVLNVQQSNMLNN